jgi:hypothetical protein
VRRHPGVIDPRLELHRIEPQIATPLDVRDAPLCHQPPNMPDTHPEHIGDAMDVK